MRKALAKLKETFFGSEMDLRVKLFNVLAMAGAANCLVMLALSIALGTGLLTILLNLVTGALSLALLLYASKSGRYQPCYTITIVAIFFGLFSFLFFSSGGYAGGMPSFFIFGVVFTVYMLEGKKMFLAAFLECAIYIGLCVYAFMNPQGVRPFPSESARAVDIVSSFLVVSLALGVTMYAQFRMYQRQQALLEQARAEAEAASRAKSTFLTNMSHEIRTPINTILGMNQMILRHSISDQVRGYSDDVQQAGEMLLGIINNILDMSKIEAGKMDIVRRPYQLASLLLELDALGRRQAQKAGLAFSLDAEGPLCPVLIGSPLHIKQIVANFLSNAAKYTREGSIALSVSQSPGSRPGEVLLRLSVTDTGIGIREESLGSLFEAFSRVDLCTHQSIEGTGLGLAIAKEMAEKMGGRVFMQSEYGRGSTFGVELPQQAQSEPAELDLSQKQGMRGELSGASFLAPQGRVLAVDDNPENLKVIKALLQRTLLRVDIAQSAEEAMEKVRATRYHVILMDYMMPGMDGVALLQALRGEGLLAGVPAVAVTADATAGARERLLCAGFTQYLSKPVAAGELEAAVCGLLPEGLVTKVRLGDAHPAEAAALGGLESGLAAHHICLLEGLRYCGGDLWLYQKRAEFFTEAYVQSKGEVLRLAAGAEGEGLVFPIHSLKSSARGLGATELCEIAERMEKHAADADYVQSALPLLLLEWERANEGLLQLLGKLAEALPAKAAADVEQDGRLTRADYVERATNAISACDWKQSQAALALLLEAEGSLEGTLRLQAVAQAVEGLQFERAETLLCAYHEYKGV